MTQPQKTIALAIGVCSFLFLALLAGLKFGGRGTPEIAPLPSPDALPVTTSRPDIESLRARLEAIKIRLDDASDALAHANNATIPTPIRNSRDDLEAASAHLAAALAFVRAHPETAGDPAPAITMTLPAEPRPTRPSAAVELEFALASVKKAFEQLRQTPGGTLGDNRDLLAADLQQAAAHLTAGINLIAPTDGIAGRGTKTPAVLYTPVTPIDTDFKQPQAAATAALTLVQTVRNDSDFSGSRHPGLIPNLTILENAAKAVISDPHNDAAASTQLAGMLRQTANDSISFVNIIANRPSETLLNQRKAHQLAEQLHALADN